MTSPDHSRPEELPEPDDVPAVSAEHLVEGQEEVPPQAAPRRYPSTLGGVIYLVVLVVALSGVAVAGTGSWRGGVRLLGAALLAAALARLLLPSADAGMLAVRHRAVDVAVLTALGVALLLLASSIPNQPG